MGSIKCCGGAGSASAFDMEKMFILLLDWHPMGKGTERTKHYVEKNYVEQNVI